MIKNEFLSKGESTAPGIKTFEEGGCSFLKHLWDQQNNKERVLLPLMSNISPQNNHLFCFKPQSWQF